MKKMIAFSSIFVLLIIVAAYSQTSGSRSSSAGTTVNVPPRAAANTPTAARPFTLGAAQNATTSGSRSTTRSASRVRVPRATVVDDATTDSTLSATLPFVPPPGVTTTDLDLLLNPLDNVDLRLAVVDVLDQLNFTTSDVVVETGNGLVTLNGIVSSPEQIDTILAAVSQVGGVRTINNNLNTIDGTLNSVQPILSTPGGIVRTGRAVRTNRVTINEASSVADNTSNDGLNENLFLVSRPNTLTNVGDATVATTNADLLGDVRSVVDTLNFSTRNLIIETDGGAVRVSGLIGTAEQATALLAALQRVNNVTLIDMSGLEVVNF